MFTSLPSFNTNITSDNTEELAEAKEIFSTRHPSSHVPTTSDLSALRSLASFISTRSSAIIATCVYTLWDVRRESQQTYIATQPPSSPQRQAAEADLDVGKTMVAFNGSVIEQYPNYLTNCQRYIDELVEGNGGGEGIELVPAKESSLLGAAVASACVKASP